MKTGAVQPHRFLNDYTGFCEYCLSDKAFIAGVMEKAMDGQFSKPAFSSSSDSTFNSMMNFVTAKMFLSTLQCLKFHIKYTHT